MASTKWTYVFQMKRQPKGFQSLLPIKNNSHSVFFHTLDLFLLFWNFAFMASYAVFSVNMISVGFMFIGLSGWSCFFHSHCHVAFRYVDRPQFILAILMDISLVYGLRLLWIMMLWTFCYASCGEYVHTFPLIFRRGALCFVVVIIGASH